MRFESCMLAEAASGLEGKLYIHGGGGTRITPPSPPWVHPTLSLVVRLPLEPADSAVDHEVTIALLDQTGEALFGPASIPVPSLHAIAPVEDEETYLQLAVTVAPIPFQRAGTYRFEVGLDGE